ncbi:transposase [Saccharopolyspora sp. NPDC000995]
MEQRDRLTRFGVEHLEAALSATGRDLEIAQRELRRLQRQAARRTGGGKRIQGKRSAGWRKAQARIAKPHAKIAGARRDGLHKLSTLLVREHGAIVLDDLNVTGMMRNRRLARPCYLFGLWCGESQTAPVRTDLSMSGVRLGPGPGHQRRTRPRCSR